MNIEKNIPMPTDKRGRKCSYPFPQMEVGDSIVGDFDAANAATAWGLRQNPKRHFIRRQFEPDKYRIWRKD